jgi:hypothetical protein
MQEIAKQLIRDNQLEQVLFQLLCQLEEVVSLKGLNLSQKRVYFEKMDSDALTII